MTKCSLNKEWGNSLHEAIGPNNTYLAKILSVIDPIRSPGGHSTKCHPIKSRGAADADLDRFRDSSGKKISETHATGTETGQV